VKSTPPSARLLRLWMNQKDIDSGKSFGAYFSRLLAGG
jgi:hypothetical protein